jgi:hypothetical protein
MVATGGGAPTAEFKAGINSWVLVPARYAELFETGVVPLQGPAGFSVTLLIRGSLLSPSRTVVGVPDSKIPA